MEERERERSTYSVYRYFAHKKKRVCVYLGSDLDGGGDEFELPSPFSVAIVAMKGEDWDGMKDDGV